MEHSWMKSEGKFNALILTIVMNLQAKLYCVRVCFCKKILIFVRPKNIPAIDKGLL